MDLSKWIAIACALAVAGTVGYFKWQNGRLNTQLEIANGIAQGWETKFEGAKATAEANVAAVLRMRADLARQEEIAAKAQAAERKRTVELNAAKKRIQDAPKADDGPVAPVLRNALDGLRPDGDGTPAPNGADANPSGAPADQPSELPVPGDAPAT